MPNWAYGPTDVTGTKKAIRAFLNRFIYPSKPETVDGVKYFARSFLSSEREEIEAELEYQFQGVPESEERELRLYPDFAWSAHTCLISGYPEHYPDTCVTLQEACERDQVDVRIRTTEPGMCFEEDIACDRHRELTSESKELARIARCKHCSTEQTLASFESADDLECWECGGTEFEVWERDM